MKRRDFLSSIALASLSLISFRSKSMIYDFSPEAMKKFADGINSALMQLGYKIKDNVSSEALFNAVVEGFAKSPTFKGFKNDEDIMQGVAAYNRIVEYVTLANNTKTPESEKPDKTKRMIKSFMVYMERLNDDGTFRFDTSIDEFQIINSKPFYQGTTEYIHTFRHKNDKDPFSNLFTADTAVPGIAVDIYTYKEFIVQNKTEGYSADKADENRPANSAPICITGKLSLMVERRTDSDYFNGIYDEITLPEFKKKK